MWNKTKGAGGKTATENRNILLKEINDLLLSGNPQLVSEVRTVLNAEGRLALEAANKASKARPLTEEEFIKQLNPANAKRFTAKAEGMKSRWGNMPEEDFVETLADGSKVTKKGWRSLTDKLVDLGAKDDDILALKVGLGQVRQRWDDLFTSIGRTLDADEIKEFKDLFGNKFKDYLGATYDVMQTKVLFHG